MNFTNIINKTYKFCFLLIITLLVLSSSIYADNSDYEPVKVQRLYNKINGVHLLSTDQNELNTLTNKDWIDEGVCFYAPSVKTNIEVKRFYNPNNGNHLYTSDPNEWNNLQTWGWNDEGLAFYGADNQLAIPIYRLSTSEPNNESYLYTSDNYEYSSLPNIDSNNSWRQEGIGWYADSLKDVNMYTYNDQKLNLPSVTNIRQLGGYTMADGRKVKNNKLIRSGALNNLSDTDKKELEKTYNLKEIVDFRSAEKSEQGSRPDIIPNGANYHFLPAMDALGIYDGETLEEMKEALSQGGEVGEIDILILMSKHHGLQQMYSKLLKTDLAKSAYKGMFEALLNNANSEDSGAVLWHCTQGKDRAGIASALVLTALGADDATIRRDYSLTTQAYTNELSKSEQIAKSRGLTDDETREFLGLIGYAYPENIQLAMDSVGSLRNYIINDLGLTEEDLNTLQNAYLE